MSSKLQINCYLIEPAANFIELLSKPITTYLYSKNDKFNLFSKWRYYFIELYNNIRDNKQNTICNFSIFQNFAR